MVERGKRLGTWWDTHHILFYVLYIFTTQNWCDGRLTLANFALVIFFKILRNILCRLLIYDVCQSEHVGIGHKPRWVVNDGMSTKVRRHREHLKVICPHFFWWRFSTSRRLNVSPHSLHPCRDLSCTFFSWRRRSEPRVNVFWQISQVGCMMNNPW